MKNKQNKVEAIVLKRLKYGETDRLVVLFSREYGKMMVLAKGVRKINSSRSASVEVGSRISAAIINGKSLNILGQTLLISSYSKIKQDLVSCTQVYQLLEIVDLLTREEQDIPEVYDLMVSTLERMCVIEKRKELLLATIKKIVELLGFSPPERLSEINLKNFIESVAERKLMSKDFFDRIQI